MKRMNPVFGLLLFAAGTLFAADSRPIGVFDSGTGGLTVLEKMLTDDFAHEKFVYLGDQANMPYGDYAAAGKSDFLRGLVIKDAEFLLGKDAKIIVIACNTATAYGYEAVNQLLKKRGDGTKVIGVVNAGARSVIRQLDLVNHPKPCAIGVMATPGTIASGVYERTIKSELKKLVVTCEVQVFSRGCAGLADAVEAGSKDAPKIATDNLRALLAEHRAKAPQLPLKAVILGCTHFPFVQRELETVAPKGVVFIDPAVDTAAECAATLKAQDRRTDAQTPMAVETYVSVAAPGLDPSKLDEKGGLTRAWKYGRTDAASDRSTVPVPILEATKGDPLKFIPFAHMIPRVREFLAARARESIFFVGAHPDDTEGFAATAFLLARNYEIHVVDLTRGELGLGPKGLADGTTAVTRIGEEKKACAVLGATPHFLCEIDGDACASKESARALCELLEKYRPKAVFTHWPVDSHADHVQTAAVVSHAIRMYNRRTGGSDAIQRYFYEVLLCQTANWHPLYSVDVSSTMAKKREMLSQYACQNPNDSLVKSKTAQAELRGRERVPPCAYAETFTTFDGHPIEGGVLEALAETARLRK